MDWEDALVMTEVETEMITATNQGAGIAGGHQKQGKGQRRTLP